MLMLRVDTLRVDDSAAMLLECYAAASDITPHAYAAPYAHERDDKRVYAMPPAAAKDAARYATRCCCHCCRFAIYAYSAFTR